MGKLAMLILALFVIVGCESDMEKLQREEREIQGKRDRLNDMSDRVGRAHRAYEGKATLEDYKQIEREKLAREIAKEMKR